MKLINNERSSLSGKFRPARKVERLCDCLEPLPGEIEMAVKMRPTCTWTKRPRGALLQFDTEDFILTVERRREPQGANGTPPFVNSKSYLFRWNPEGDTVWLLVCLGQAPAKE